MAFLKNNRPKQYFSNQSILKYLTNKSTDFYRNNPPVIIPWTTRGQQIPE